MTSRLGLLETVLVMDDASPSQFGPDAQTDRDYESLTQKQASAVDAIIDTDVDATRAEMGEKAGVCPTYIAYVEENFPHIIHRRRGTMKMASDGGQTMYEVRLPADEVWKAIRLLPEELSSKLFHQVRDQ